MSTEHPNQKDPIDLSDHTDGDEYDVERIIRRVGQNLQLIVKEAIESSNALAGYMLDLAKSIKEAVERQDDEARDDFHGQLVEFEEEVAYIKECMTNCFKKYIETQE